MVRRRSLRDRGEVPPPPSAFSNHNTLDPTLDRSTFDTYRVRIALVRDAKHGIVSGNRQKRAVHWPRSDFGCEIKLQILDWHPPRQLNRRRMFIRWWGGQQRGAKHVPSGRGRAASNYRVAGI